MPEPATKDVLQPIDRLIGLTRRVCRHRRAIRRVRSPLR